MKQKLLFLFFVWVSLISAQQVTIDLSTGKNDDGTLMSAPPPDVANGVSVADSDWSVLRPNETSPVTTKTRHTYTGWSTPILTVTAGMGNQSRWITDMVGWAVTGDYFYTSKSFQIPNSASNAVLNLRSLSFVRNWTYLVRTDVFPNTEEEITRTAWMSDGAKGWLNSRSPEVYNKVLIPGATYKIKVRVYTNNGNVTNALNVHGLVTYTTKTCSVPEPTVNSVVSYCQNSVASPLTATGNNLLWYTVAIGGAGSSDAPIPNTNTVGTTSYYVSQTDNGCESARAKIDVVVKSIPNSPTVTNGSLTYCQGSTASPLTATGSNLLWYTVASGGTGSSVAPTPSTDTAGTTSYYVSQTVNGCESARTSVTVTVSPSASLLTLNSANSSQNVDVNTAIQNITYTFSNATSATVTGLPTGVTSSINGNSLTISGVPTVTGTFNYTVTTSGGCGLATLNATITVVSARDWRLAPNSYIFTGKEFNMVTGKYDGAEVDGLFIPVKKAYTMWLNGMHVGGMPIPSGNATADVLWEDMHGLIKTGQNYSLNIIGTGENAEIEIPINKALKGNAVITYKIDGEVYWSWHVWVTDDPTNGSTYKSYSNVRRTLSNGTTEVIPDSDWGWMDRNLGAVGSSITGGNWNRNGGLLYQWGRKDPFPSLDNRGEDFYEVTGSIGQRIRHHDSHETNQWLGTSFESLKKFVKVSNALVQNNIRLSIKNPLSLIYVQNDNDTNEAFYNGNKNLPYNWFGDVNLSNMPYGFNPLIDTSNNKWGSNRLGELNLWSDNAQGKITVSNYNFNSQNRAYQNKSSYDPCPNGWRVPSMLAANIGNYSYVDDVRIDYSPFGINPNGGTTNNTLSTTILPSNANMATYAQNFKIYPQIGFDMTNVSGNNMGFFPGTGMIYRYNSQYTDSHETFLWTSTISRWWDATPAVNARAMRLVPDAQQYINNYQPDATNFPNVYGLYKYYPLWGSYTSDAAACRCVKDPLYTKNTYDFPTKYFATPIPKYEEGLAEPNSYQIVKTANIEGNTIAIPISKAFSVQSKILGNAEILDAVNHNNLKVNILWTTNPSLISNISLTNTSPIALADITSTNINVKIAPNQSGNAVVTLHNGSITNPIYWSWHIWVTNSEITNIVYDSAQPITGATNYINYTKFGGALETEFMDRNLGAEEAFPTVMTPANPTADELSKIKISGGLQYQWGRKDPIPPFMNPDGSSYPIYLGNTNSDGSTSYTLLDSTTYNNANGNYIKAYNNYTDAGNANVLSTDKISDKLNKVLKYSVQNPLVFMVPSNFAPVFSNAVQYTNGSDWLSNESNLGANRWGRGDVKSVFDPCPKDYRIPDVVAVAPDAIYNSSPWSKSETNGSVALDVSSIYYGVKVGDGLGYQFNDNAYNIGNYPYVGIRGERDLFSGTLPDYTKLSSNNSGIWTSALTSNYYGRAINFAFNRSINKMATFNSVNDPYFAMNCRCVKIKNVNNEQQGPILAFPITQNTGKKANNIFNNKEIQQKVKSNLVLYPIPVDSVLNINATDNKDYYYQIYNMAGQMVKEGRFINKQTNLSDLSSGAYLVRVNDSNEIVKIIKK